MTRGRSLAAGGVVLVATAVAAVALAATPSTSAHRSGADAGPQTCGAVPSSTAAESAGLTARLFLPATVTSGATVPAALTLQNGDPNVVSSGPLPDTNTVHVPETDPATIDVLLLRGGAVVGRAAAAGRLARYDEVKPIDNVTDPADLSQLVVRGTVAMTGCPAPTGAREALPPGDYQAIAVEGPFISDAVPVTIVAAGIPEPTPLPSVPAPTASPYPLAESDAQIAADNARPTPSFVMCDPSNAQLTLDTDYPSYPAGSPVTIVATTTGNCSSAPLANPASGSITDSSGHTVWNFLCDKPICLGGFATEETLSTVDPDHPDTRTVTWATPRDLPAGTYTFTTIPDDAKDAPTYSVSFSVT